LGWAKLNRQNGPSALAKRKLSIESASEVRAAYREIQSSVATKLGREHFNGVTVQRMVSGDGYELIIGSSIDAQFGPVLLFGAGGRLVEMLDDQALALPPLNTTLARRFIEQTRIFRALSGIRGRKPVDISALERLLVRFSQLVIEQNCIREIDINPLFASSDTLVALDARVILYPPETDLTKTVRPAIRPYPSKYACQLVLHNGQVLNIRPIRPEDEPAFIRFHSTLSEESVYKRYFFMMNLESRIQHERLTRMCFIDYDRQMALVAERPSSAGNPGEIVAVGRLVKALRKNEAEIAVLVSDSFQRRGIGKALVSRLVEFATDEGLELLTASYLAENEAIEKVFKAHGFTFRDIGNAEIRRAELKLAPDTIA
jgi:acetyltransferase